ncbi:diiron oxygenase [Streptomyces sp. NPDC051909]|uniref:diiron oxygenase n=1 Tax=Streptomyces sp. NPDC051909 TaxID=3154944 RepID=UPI00342C3559
MYGRRATEPLVPERAEGRARIDAYAARFGRWEELAGVRTRPQRSFGGPGSLYFPPELYPVATHPLVTGLDGERVEWLLLRRLHAYLDFTSELESLAVMPVATAISRGRSGLLLPEGMRADAFKIVTDEAWHAQTSYDFAHQLQSASGLPLGRPADGPPAFVERLDAIRDELPPEIRGVEALLFAIVSETLISGILAEIPRDERLPRSVREHVRDHAEDEGRHHVYFRDVLQHLWAALTPKERAAVGPHVPAAVYAFLEPDYARTVQDLRMLGLSDEEAAQVVEESWPRERLVRDVAEAARPVVRYFGEAGALDDARTRAVFEDTGLLGRG